MSQNQRLEHRQSRIDRDLEKRLKAYEIIRVCFMFVLFLILVTLSVFLFFFAFYNPDPKNVWYIPGLVEPRKSPSVAMEAAKLLKLKVNKDYPLNMATVFHNWFVMGFWTVINYALLIAMTLSNSEAWLKKLNRFKVAIIIIQLSVSVVLILWIFLGVSWRFSDAGKIASGDQMMGLANNTSKFDN